MGSLFGNGIIEITSILPEMDICGEMYFVTALIKNNNYSGYKSTPMIIKCTDEEDIYIELKINNIIIQGYKYEELIRENYKEKIILKNSNKLSEKINRSLIENNTSKDKLIKIPNTNIEYVNNTLDNEKFFPQSKKANFRNLKENLIAAAHKFSSTLLSPKLNPLTYNNLSFKENDNDNEEDQNKLPNGKNYDGLNSFLLNKIFENNRKSYHHEVPITISNVLSSEILFHARLSLKARCPPLSFLILAAPITRHLSNDFIIIKGHKLFNILQGIKLSTITLPLINGCSPYINLGEKIVFTIDGKLKQFPNSEYKSTRQIKYLDHGYISNIINNTTLDNSLNSNDYFSTFNLNFSNLSLTSFIESDNKLIFSSIHPYDQSKSYHIIVIVDPLSLVTNTSITSRTFLFKVDLILSSVNGYYDTKAAHFSSKYRRPTNFYNQCFVYSDSSKAYILSGSLENPIFHVYSPIKKLLALTQSQAAININRIYYKQLHTNLLSFNKLRQTVIYKNLSEPLSEKYIKNSYKNNLKSTFSNFLVSAFSSSFLGKLAQFLDFTTKALLTIQINSNTSNPALTLSNLLLTTDVLSQTISLMCKPDFIYFNQLVKLTRNLIKSPFIPPLSTIQRVIEDVTNSEPPNFTESLRIPYRLRVFFKRLVTNDAKNTGIDEKHLEKLRELLILIVENTWWMLELPNEVNKKLMQIIGENTGDEMKEVNIKDDEIIENYNTNFNYDYDNFPIQTNEKISNDHNFKYSNDNYIKKSSILTTINNKLILKYTNSVSQPYVLNPFMFDNLSEPLRDINSDKYIIYSNVTTEIISSLRRLAASVKPLPSEEPSNTFFIKLLDALLYHNIFQFWDELINIWHKTPKNILMENYPDSDGEHLLGYLEWLNENNEQEVDEENPFYRVKDGKIVEKGDYEPITGKTFWSPIVMCSCKNEENECSIKESEKIFNPYRGYAKNYPKF